MSTTTDDATIPDLEKAVAKAERKPALTEYVVLLEGSEGWNPFGDAVKAASAEAAVRQKAKAEGRYIAIPARSWKPVTVRVEQTTKITLETA